jgi:hypothetical protein
MAGWARASEDKTTAGSAAVVAAITGMLMVRFGERGVVMECVLISAAGIGWVAAVTSVANVTDVINDASVISVNLSHLFIRHNNSRRPEICMPNSSPSKGDFHPPGGTPVVLRLGEWQPGVATLFRE